MLTASWDNCPQKSPFGHKPRGLFAFVPRLQLSAVGSLSFRPACHPGALGFLFAGAEMAKLTTKARKKMPAKDFAGPGRSYPVEDRSHAANAKARASQAVNSGRMSRSTEAKIDRKANAVLKKGGRGR